MKSTALPIYIVLSILIAGLATTANAQPGSGVRLGPMTLLTPEVSGSYNYNDNVNLRRRALDEGNEKLSDNVSDDFISTEVSLSLLHRARNSRYSGRAWYGTDLYDKFSELDSEYWGVNSEWFWAQAAGNTTVKAAVSYQFAVDRSNVSRDFFEDVDISDQLENVSERVERDIFKFATNLNQKLMTDVRGVFIFNYDDTDFKQDRFNDRTRFEYIGELNYQYSDKTQSYARIGISLDDDEGFEGDAEKPFYLVGFRYKPTAKLSLDASVGYEKYTRTPIGGFDQDGTPLNGVELEDSNTKFNLALTYAATPKSRFVLRGRNGYDSVASPGSSSREEVMFSLVYRHQTTNRLNQSLLVSWREDNYLNPIPTQAGLVDELKETTRFQYEIDYQTVRPWLNLFGELSYEDGSSRIPGDSYNETSVSVGAKLRY